jgi:hypothetical protein
MALCQAGQKSKSYLLPATNFEGLEVSVFQIASQIWFPCYMQRRDWASLQKRTHREQAEIRRSNILDSSQSISTQPKVDLTRSHGIDRWLQTSWTSCQSVSARQGVFWESSVQFLINSPNKLYPWNKWWSKEMNLFLQQCCRHARIDTSRHGYVYWIVSFEGRIEIPRSLSLGSWST